MGYTQNCEYWHGASLGTMIMIQEEPIWRTMWGSCFGNKVVIFWPHLGLLNHWVVKWKTGHSCRPLVLFNNSLHSLFQHLVSTIWRYLHKRRCLKSYDFFITFYTCFSCSCWVSFWGTFILTPKLLHITTVWVSIHPIYQSINSVKYRYVYIELWSLCYD